MVSFCPAQASVPGSSLPSSQSQKSSLMSKELKAKPEPQAKSGSEAHPGAETAEICSVSGLSAHSDRSESRAWSPGATPRTCPAHSAGASASRPTRGMASEH